MERIDVLILLRWVFRELDRSVGPPLKPFGMRFDVRMIGRALESDVERDFESVCARRGDQPPEIVQRTEFGVYRLVSALRRADRPRAAGIAGRGLERIVAAFALDASDG